jgi:hypothetical protein
MQDSQSCEAIAESEQETVFIAVRRLVMFLPPWQNLIEMEYRVWVYRVWRIGGIEYETEYRV